LVVAFVKATPFPTSDSAYFEFVGRQMLHGAQLYRDIWDNKLPSIYLTNALWQMIMGEQYRLHIAAEITIQALSAVLFALVLRNMGIRSWPAATFVFIAIYVVLPAGYNQTEQYALPLSLLALLCLQKEKPIACGIALVAAASYWIPAALLVLPVVAWWRADAAALKRFFSAASAAAAVAVAAAFALIGAGPLRALAQSWLLYVTEPGPAHHYGKLGAAKTISINLRLGLYISGIGVLLPLFAARVRKPQTREQRLALWWSIATLAGAMTSARFFSHYFFLAIPALIAAIAVFPPRPVRWLNACAVAFAAYFAVRSAQFMVHEAKVNDLEYTRIAHATGAIERAIGRGAVIEGDAEPGLLLAAHARTRTPYDLAISTNRRFVASATSGNAYPKIDAWLLTSADVVVPPRTTAVCRSQLEGWRLLVRRELARRFTAATCARGAAQSARLARSP
jgi:hypothetical protein